MFAASTLGEIEATLYAIAIPVDSVKWYMSQKTANEPWNWTEKKTMTAKTREMMMAIA